MLTAGDGTRLAMTVRPFFWIETISSRWLTSRYASAPYPVIRSLSWSSSPSAAAGREAGNAAGAVDGPAAGASAGARAVTSHNAAAAHATTTVRITFGVGMIGPLWCVT